MRPWNTVFPNENGRHVADGIFKFNISNRKCCILIAISQEFVSKDPIENKSAICRYLSGAGRTTSHYMNQVWLSLPTYICLNINIARKATFWLFLIVSHLNASQYDNAFFFVYLIFMSQIMFYFLHSTAVLSIVRRRSLDTFYSLSFSRHWHR